MLFKNGLGLRLRFEGPVFSRTYCKDNCAWDQLGSYFREGLFRGGGALSECYGKLILVIVLDNGISGHRR